MPTFTRVIAVALGSGWLNLLTIQASDLNPVETLQALRESDQSFRQNYSRTYAVEGVALYVLS